MMFIKYCIFRKNVIHYYSVLKALCSKYVFSDAENSAIFTSFDYQAFSGSVNHEAHQNELSRKMLVPVVTDVGLFI